ncbi:MAG: bifunctional DNA-formamidopyrimidine glycosylase/DNA-(apurinic or apyrimidinic site) lyase [Acidobacteria bacterium]|nr:bifunctional DNA-formamidopyrimidine glycosylase/DNA-(apurinic or apyrimidinic site) lyase [Acidobacteriota bacterium]
MPELPEVETIVRTIRPLVLGQQITGVVLRALPSNGPASPVAPRILSCPPQEFIKGVCGTRIERIERYGKHILFQLRRPEKKKTNSVCSLVIHLGMTGRLTCESTPEFQSRHTHLVVGLKSRNGAPATWLHYTDMRQFGRLWLTSHSEPKLASLGPDPFEMSFEEFFARLHARRAMLKSLLLNQRFLRGLGNIYADESLFRAGVHPSALASRLSRHRALRLFQAIRGTLRLAIERGGSSVSNYVDGLGRAGSFQHLHQVYRRTGQPCFQCGSRILKILVASRSSHFCRRCQR